MTPAGSGTPPGDRAADAGAAGSDERGRDREGRTEVVTRLRGIMISSFGGGGGEVDSGYAGGDPVEGEMTLVVDRPDAPAGPGTRRSRSLRTGR